MSRDRLLGTGLLPGAWGPGPALSHFSGWRCGCYARRPPLCPGSSKPLISAAPPGPPSRASAPGPSRPAGPVLAVLGPGHGRREGKRPPSGTLLAKQTQEESRSSARGSAVSSSRIVVLCLLLEKRSPKSGLRNCGVPSPFSNYVSV